MTWSYFGMLLGKPDVKADTWVLRFVRSAVGHSVGSADAKVLVTRAAEMLGVDPTQLDHAIWLRARSRFSR